MNVPITYQGRNAKIIYEKNSFNFVTTGNFEKYLKLIVKSKNSSESVAYYTVDKGSNINEVDKIIRRFFPHANVTYIIDSEEWSGGFYGNGVKRSYLSDEDVELVKTTLSARSEVIYSNSYNKTSLFMRFVAGDWSNISLVKKKF